MICPGFSCNVTRKLWNITSPWIGIPFSYCSSPSLPAIATLPWAVALLPGLLGLVRISVDFKLRLRNQSGWHGLSSTQHASLEKKTRPFSELRKPLRLLAATNYPPSCWSTLCLTVQTSSSQHWNLCLGMGFLVFGKSAEWFHKSSQTNRYGRRSQN